MNVGLISNTYSGITGGQGALQSARTNADKAKFSELLERFKSQNEGRGTISSDQIAENGRLNGEYTTGRRISGIVNALTGLFFKAGMTFGSIVGPAVLAYVGYESAVIDQTPLAEEGILWLVCVIPAILLLLAMWIISKYELEDDVIDKINREIEARHQ